MDESYFHRYCINTDPTEGEIQVLSCAKCREKTGGDAGYRIGEAFVIHCVLEGRGWFDDSRNRYRLTAGDGFVVFPDRIYKYAATAAEPWMICSVSFKGEGIQEILEEIGLTPGHPVMKLDHLRRVQVLFHQIERCMQGTRTSGYNLMLEGYARLLLAQFSFGKPFAQTELASVSYGSARVILHAAQWMIQHYHEPVVIRELADRFCCGTERFARLFRRHMGMSPKEFLIRLRMDKARNLMYSNLAVKHVAQQVGYDDALYFSRLFKKTYDLSPDEFRKRIPLRQGAASWRKDGSFGLAKPEPDRVLAFETVSRIGEGSGDSGSL